MMAASVYYVVSNEIDNRVFKHNFIFRHTFTYKQTILTKQSNYNNFLLILCSYFRFTAEFLDVFFLLLAVKSTQKNLRERHKFLAPPLLFMYPDVELWNIKTLFFSRIFSSYNYTPIPCSNYTRTSLKFIVLEIY